MTMTASASHFEQAPTMTEAMRQDLVRARQQRRKIDRAAGVATFNAWTSAVLAALCVPFALLSITSLAAAMVLGVVAYVEFTGRRMLRELNDRGPVVLACNQAALGGLVILYAVWHLYLAYAGKGYYEQMRQSVPELETTLVGMDSLVRSIEYLTYSLLIVGTIAFQGLTALYYWTRRPHLRRFVRQTPAWAIEVLRAAA